LESYVDHNQNSEPDNGEICSHLTGIGNTEIFECNAGSEGIKNVICFVNSSKSYQTGNNQSIQINVGGDIPNITLYNPANNTKITDYYASEFIVFEYSVNDLSQNLFNCSIWINGVERENQPNLQEDINYNFTLSLSNENYTWYIQCDDFSECDNIGVSESRELEVALEETLEIRSMDYDITKNSECTSMPAVSLNLVYAPSASECRFGNENKQGWTNMIPKWESCVPLKFWVLNRTKGTRTVYAQINYTDGSITNLSDTIEYDPYGRCMDLTEPNPPTVIDEGDFTNDDTRLHAYWYGAYDPDAIKYNLELNYEYKVNDSNGNTINDPSGGWNSTGSDTEVTLTNLNLIHGETYWFHVRVINSNNLTAIYSSDGITVDTSLPVVNLNIHPNENKWTNINDLTFSWIGSDTVSGIKGYSIVLDHNKDTIPDKILDIQNINLKTYNNLLDNNYSFHIRAKDNADNWGDSDHTDYIGIDTNPPTQPELLNPVVYADTTSVEFIWTESLDLPQNKASGVNNYYLNVTNIDTQANIFSEWVGKIQQYELNSSHGIQQGNNYMANVIARDKAGMNSSFIEALDTTPPKITFVKPRGDIINSPRIVAKTNEKSVCYYNIDASQNKKFAYTNSTYHESQIDIAPGYHTMEIICSDMVGLTNSTSTNFNFTDKSLESIDIELLNQGFIGHKLKINITTTPRLGEIRKNNFKLYLVQELQEEYVFEDLGGGIYNILLIPENNGTFQLNITVYDKISDTTFIDIKDFRLKTIFSGDLSSQKTTKDYYVYTAKDYSTFGIASDSQNPEIEVSNDYISVGSRQDGVIYIFQTRSNALIKNKYNYLKKGTFDNYLNTFGYHAEDKYYITSYFDYKDIIFNEIFDLKKGKHEILIRNLGLDEDDNLIIQISEKNN
jgi:hypothetical protein